MVVEDEAMLSLNLETMLLELGCVVAGTADKLDDALHIARSSEFDVALLDVNLGGKRVVDLINVQRGEVVEILVLPNVAA